ncbi:MAG: tetratricopeptide repeat protein [Spirochaetes bacterium]|nr:tetratricopeptide repeat protein [Spirochaetota bacterium]
MGVHRQLEFVRCRGMIRIPIKAISKETLEKRYYTVAPLYEGMLDGLYQDVQRILNEAGMKVTVRKRLKSFESLFSKVLKKARQIRLYSHFEGIEPTVVITDFLGIRIVCPFLEDTIKVEDLIRRNLEVVEQEYKGEEYSPHEFGYVSTHIIVKIGGPQEVEGVLQEEILAEIQIRTILQDAWAEVEHELMYKAEFTPFDEPLRRKLSAVNANLSLSDIIFQEIRDYQRKLQQELRTRRKSFLQKIQAESIETIGEDVFLSNPPPASTPPLVVSKESLFYQTLDNLLLEALTAHNQQQYSRAIELYTHILHRKPKRSIRALVYIHRGMAFFGESNYDKALEDFTAAINLEPENPRIYFYRGVVQRFRKDLNGALLDLSRSLELDPYHFDSLYNRAQVYFSLGNYVQAAEDCRQALALKPKIPEARRFLQVIEQKLRF